jgi:outer membrane beta-barrel protein
MTHVCLFESLRRVSKLRGASFTLSAVLIFFLGLSAEQVLAAGKNSKSAAKTSVPAPAPEPEPSSTAGNVDEIEQLFIRSQTETPKKEVEAGRQGINPNQGQEGAPKASETLDLKSTDSAGDALVEGFEPSKANSSYKEVSDLANLSAFGDIAVIQKRFLPKTGRFEGYLGFSNILNDKFFYSYGLDMRLAWYFREHLGLEFSYLFLKTNAREVTTQLESVHQVVTKSIVTPNSYTGLAFKWAPIYGKFTWLNNRITPYDLYFDIGLGMTATNQSENEITFHLGTGQVFALTKSSAIRWDFTWNFFQGKSVSATGATATAGYDNLFISIGMSFFFPEARYR